MSNNPFAVLMDPDSSPEGQKSSPEGEKMVIDTLTRTSPAQVTRSGRTSNPPTRFSNENFGPTRVSPKRTADEANVNSNEEKPDASKKSKTKHDQSNKSIDAQLEPSGWLLGGNHPSGSGGGRGGRGGGGRGGRGNSGSSISSGRDLDHDWRHSNHNIIRRGTIINARHFSKWIRGTPDSTAKEHLAKIADTTRDEVYCKSRYHIVLTDEKHHYVTVPIWSKKNGFGSEDPGEFLKVIRAGEAATGPNETGYNEVLEVVHNGQYWEDRFLEGGKSKTWAHYRAPNSIQKAWNPAKVGELVPASYQALMHIFAEHFSLDPHTVQTAAQGQQAETQGDAMEGVET